MRESVELLPGTPRCPSKGSFAGINVPAAGVSLRYSTDCPLLILPHSLALFEGELAGELIFTLSSVFPLEMSSLAPLLLGDFLSLEEMRELHPPLDSLVVEDLSLG